MVDPTPDPRHRTPARPAPSTPHPSPDVYVVLLHHPVLNKNGVIVTTAVTNMDIHDIARSSRTYGVRRFFVVTPVRALRVLAEKIIDHWETGFGSTYNVTRKDALQLVAIEPDLDAALALIERESGAPPVVVVTSARSEAGSIGFEDLRGRLRAEARPGARPYALLFGTGWGLAPEVLQRADLRLAPLHGRTEYNHLSVRAAAAIILDRLLSPG